jgi:hypothetical protein
MPTSQLNIFLNSYQQPENKLTYNLLCLIEHIDTQKEFVEFLCVDRLALNASPVQSLKTVYGGGSSNPDGALVLRMQSGATCEVFIENKTVRLGLSAAQLRAHLDEYCRHSNQYLLVITPRPTDAGIARSISKEKVFFRTWSEIAGKLHELEMRTGNHDFIAAQFVEYGKLSGEFQNMLISDEEVRTYIAYVRSKPEAKLKYLFEKVASELAWGKFSPFNNVRAKWEDNWGRMGLQFEYDHRPELSTSFFFGVYHDERDHGIPFKADEPELAFFFDIEPGHQPILERDRPASFLACLSELEKHGFEQNFTKRLSANSWRLLCHRTPLSQVMPLTPESVTRRLYDLIETLGKQPGIVDTFLGGARKI